MYGDLKDLPRATVSDKILRDKAIKIAAGLKFDEYQSRLASMVYNFFDKNARDTSDPTIARIISENQQLKNELHKSITRKCQRRKVYSSY